MDRDSADSVPLTVDDGEPGGDARAPGLKGLLALFVIFLVVVSDVFTNSVISGFGASAVRGREPTTWGIALQGIFLVIGYSLATYLIGQGVL